MSEIKSLPILASFQNSEFTVTPDEKHEFLMTTAEIAKGYGVSSSTVRKHLIRNTEDFIENQHFIRGTKCPTGKQSSTLWTKRGVIRLGMFIKSKRAIQFRDWAESLILGEIDSKIIKQNNISQLPDIKSYRERLRITETQQESYPPIPNKTLPFESPKGEVIIIPGYSHNFLGDKLVKLSDLQRVAGVSNREIRKRRIALKNDFIYRQDYICYDSEIYVNFFGKQKLQLNVFITSGYTPPTPYMDRNFIDLITTLSVNWHKFSTLQKIKITKDVETFLQCPKAILQKSS